MNSPTRPELTDLLCTLDKLAADCAAAIAVSNAHGLPAVAYALEQGRPALLEASELISKRLAALLASPQMPLPLPVKPTTPKNFFENEHPERNVLPPSDRD